MPRIEVREPSPGRFHAEIDGRPHLCDFGRSAAEAIGNLVMYFPTTLGISLKLPATCEAPSPAEAATEYQPLRLGRARRRHKPANITAETVEAALSGEYEVRK